MVKFKRFVHKNVSANGDVKSGGSVHTQGGIIKITSVKHPFITITMPRNYKKEVHQIQVKFSSKQEMKRLLK